jgi:hypothetical protein
MAWQLQLEGQHIHRLEILLGPPPQVAVIDTRYRVRFYDLLNGAFYDDLHLDGDLLDQDSPESRLAALEALTAPNGQALPMVHLNGCHLYTSQNGHLHLIHDLNAGLTLDDLPLEMGSDLTVRLVDWDRNLGTIAALTSNNHLYFFRQHMLMTLLELEAEVLNLFVTASGSQVILVQRDRLCVLDTTGKLLRQQEIYYRVGPSALSPDGNFLLLGDADHQVLRLYNRDLIPTRQQHAVDLLSRARQLQLFSEELSSNMPFQALAMANNGQLCFAMANVLCASHIKAMGELPQPRLLL